MRWVLTVSLAILSGIPSSTFAQEKKLYTVDVEFGDLQMTGGRLDRESARRALFLKRRDFNKCGQALGKLDLSFQASASGEVTNSKAVLLPKQDQETEDCFLKALSQADFSQAGIETSVKMSIQFEIGRDEQDRLALAKQSEESSAKKPKSNPDQPKQMVETKKTTCDSSKPKDNFSKTCLSLNGLHLRALGASKFQNSFRVICDCVRDNFDLKKMMPEDSCRFSTDDAFTLLKSRPVYVMCIQGR